MLSIRLLGPTSVLLDDQPVPLKRRKSRALLYYLAATPQPVTRRQVSALLWGDHNSDTARHNLRTTLYGLRQELGDHLRTEDEWIQLEKVEVDARIFRAALEHPKSDDLEPVLALYRGDFMVDFDLPDSDEYENWMAVEREHFRRLAIRGNQIVSRRHEAQGNYAAALAALSAALVLDPFQEDLQREALRLHYYAGDRAGAIRRYEEFSRLLEHEIGVQPMAETRALYQSIINGTLPAPSQSPSSVPTPEAAERIESTFRQSSILPRSPRPASDIELPDTRLLQVSAPAGPPFTGRAAELQRLADTHTGHQLLVIEGDVGFGKTRLVETFISQLQINPGDAPPPLVLVGRARQLESRIPYQPLIEALRVLFSTRTWAMQRSQINLPALWWQEIARLLPEVNESGPISVNSRTPDLRTPDESRLWEGVFQLLVALAQSHAQPQPIIFFIDDLHWSDVATLGLLGYLVRQAAVAQLPITFLAASLTPQPGSEVAILLQSLQREGLLLEVPLQPLAVSDVMALARWLSPNYGYPLGNWLYRASEGIPLVLAELVRTLRDQKILLPDGSVDLNLLPSTPVVPPSIYTIIQARLVTLSDAARRVLDAAVAIGREFEYEVVARSAALSDGATLDALDELRQARLITAIDQRHFAFVHSLVMEVAYQEVGELRHRLLHRRVAVALESIHANRLEEMAGLIAQHYAEGEQPDLAAKYARIAGHRAMHVAAWKAAIGYFHQALTATSAAEQPELLLALGNAQLQAGELAAAEETLQAALQMPTTQRQLPILRATLRSLGETLLLQARYQTGIDLARRYAEHPDAEVRGAAQFVWGTLLSLEGVSPEEATRHLHAAKELLREGGVPEGQMVQVDFELGNIAAQQGRLQEAIANYERALDLSRPDKITQDATDQAMRFHILAYNNLAYHLHLLGDPRAEEYIQKAIVLAREKGVLTLTPYLLSTKGEIALAQEDFAGAESAFQHALAFAHRLKQPERVAGVTANMGLLAYARGQNELAMQQLSTALSLADSISSRFLAAQIRLWLAPLLSPAAARNILQEARQTIVAAHYDRLLPALNALEERFSHQVS